VSPVVVMTELRLLHPTERWPRLVAPPAETWVIVPIVEVYEDTELEFLVVGRSGSDGIDFGFRKGYSGLWAFYPIDQEFRPVASTVAELVDGW
jgi:hypothetical protein